MTPGAETRGERGRFGRSAPGGAARLGLSPEVRLRPVDPPRILLIEDSGPDARLVKEMLIEAWGTKFELRHVESLADVDPHVMREWTNCILLDLSLPDAEGLHGFFQLRDMVPDAPIVVLSGRSDESVALDAVHQGAQDYLLKGRVDSWGLSRAINYARERKAFEAQLAHQALHDPLTGLPNRLLFRDRLAVALARSERYPLSLAVLFLDLNRFKTLNDSFGHRAGDRLLVTVADRLQTLLRPGDTVARFGGDEFVILLEDINGEEDAVAVAQRIADAIARPASLDVGEVYVTTSIGIAIARGGDDPEALLRSADAAMYRAKERGGIPWELFDEGMRERAVARLEMESDLYRAVERRELTVAYQPIVELSSGLAVGAEALVRWPHAQRGLIMPDQFIPLAEETGLILPIGEQVLHQACHDAAGWIKDGAGTGMPSISVNLSARQLTSVNLAGVVREALEASGLPPELLCLEITESVLMDDVDASQFVLYGLKDLGVRLAIDDFGTGYSALGYLKRYPIDTLKLDRTLIDGLGSNSQDRAIVAAVITLAEALDVEVVAEGVETARQRAELQTLGCRLAQGWLFSKALPPHLFPPTQTHPLA